MLNWLFLAVDRFGRFDPGGLARRMNYVPARLVRRIATAKLVSVLRYVYRHNPVQRARWQRAGIRLGDLCSPEVLPELPFCDGKLLARHPEAFFCVPPEELTHVITTAGTTGQAKKLYFTGDDMDRQVRLVATNLRRLPGASRVLVMFRVTGATWTAGPILRRGVEKAGYFGLLSGIESPPEEQFQLIREYDIDVLMTMPTYAHRLTLEADQDLREFGIKYIVLGAEPWTERLRAELEAAWGAKVLDAYGTNECGTGLASECVMQDGLHVAEADFWVEIVDPETGKPLPDGTDGEVVVTTLSRRGMPLVRYRVGDIAHLVPDRRRCACGLPLRKMSRIRGRTDDMLILGGSNVFPDQFDQAILTVPGITDYQITVEKDGYKDVLHLTVECDSNHDNLRETLINALKSIELLRLHADSSGLVTFGRIRGVPRGTLAADRPKTIRVIDSRR